MSAADDGAAREHHLWILDLESAAGRTMAELHLSGRKTTEDTDRAVRGIGKSTEPGRPGLWRDIRSVLVGVDLYRVSRVQFALSLGHLKTWLLNDQKVALAI